MNTYVHHEEVHKAYLAGIFDGEGHISLMPNQSGTFNIKVGITQKNWAFIKGIQEKFDGSIDAVNPKGVWQCYFTSALKCKTFLEYVLPYLILRKTEAELAIAYCTLRLQLQARGRHLTDKEHLAYTLIHIKMEEAREIRQTAYTQAGE